MKISRVDFFYLSMPEIHDRADGSQDSLLVRVEGGEHVGWGECEAAPLVSIASWCCPMSHSVCRPVRDSVLDQTLESAQDIPRILRLAKRNSDDLLQADHTLAGIDMALWDLLGKKMDLPVYRLLGYDKAFPKTPYASQLFGDDPQETYTKTRRVRELGFRATKVGWGGFGEGSSEDDAEHVRAAREGLGDEGILLVDAGKIWGDDVDEAAKRLAALEDCRVLWLEEPFVAGALAAYKTLSERCRDVKLAGGEDCHDEYSAQHTIDYAGIGYVQIDAGRTGITVAKKIADYAAPRGVTFVNHTFTTQLALSASLQPYAGLEKHTICEYPVEPTSLGRELTRETLARDAEGLVHIPERPGLGVEPDENAIRKYLVDVEIKVGGRTIFSTPRVV